MNSFTVALAGNPNTGKTSLFNALTGFQPARGNWPRVTVERKRVFQEGGRRGQLVDLPGIYSLGAASLDEEIAADFLLKHRPDMAVVVADASNLEEPLPGCTDAGDGRSPALALNMMDAASDKGITIDTERLSSLLGIPVVPTARRKRNWRA